MVKHKVHSFFGFRFSASCRFRWCYMPCNLFLVSLKLNGGITFIVKFALLVMWPIVGYFLDTWNSESTDPVTVSLNIGDFGSVVRISIEATNGIVDMPTGDFGETFILNTGG